MQKILLIKSGLIKKRAREAVCVCVCLTLILLSFFWILCATWSDQYFSWRKSQKILPTSELTQVGWSSTEPHAGPQPALDSAPGLFSSFWLCKSLHDLNETESYADSACVSLTQTVCMCVHKAKSGLCWIWCFGTFVLINCLLSDPASWTKLISARSRTTKEKSYVVLFTDLLVGSWASFLTVTWAGCGKAALCPNQLSHVHAVVR